MLRYSLSNLACYLVSFSSLEQATYASQQTSTSLTTLDQKPGHQQYALSGLLLTFGAVNFIFCLPHLRALGQLRRLNIMEVQTTEIEENSTMQTATNDKAVRNETSAQQQRIQTRTMSSLYFRRTFRAFHENKIYRCILVEDKHLS